MKVFKLPSLVLIVTALVLSGCWGKTPRELIVNRWKLTEITGSGEEMIKMQEKFVVGKFEMDLTASHNAVLYGVGGSRHTGTFGINNREMTFVLKDDANKLEDDSFEVIEISTDKLVINKLFTNVTMRFVSVR